MSDKSEAAQKWAGAKAALEAADTAFEAAKLAYSKAEDAEFHAWQALEALAGRTSQPPVEPFVDATTIAMQYARTGKLPDAHRHSLPVKPIG